MIIIVKNAYGLVSFEFHLHEPSKPPSVPPVVPAPTSSNPAPNSDTKKPQLREETDEVWIAPWLRTIPPKK